MLPILFFLTIFKLIDTDLWLHMKAGQVVMETGSFIYRDIFSYTAAGREWLYHEWLFGVISYSIYSAFGVNGLIFGKAVLLTSTFFIIYRCMRLRGVNPYLASFILSTAVLAARFRFTERPHIFKFLFVALFIYLLELFRLKGKNKLWLLPVFQLLWTNIHGSFILGPAIIAIYLFSDAISGKRQNLKMLTTIIFTSLATLMNPYGFKLILFSLGFGEQAALSSISEWAPTHLKDFYGAFGLLFILGIASFVLKYKRIEIVDILIFGLFSYLSIKAIRFTALFSLATAPIIAANWSYLTSDVFPAFTKTNIRKVFTGFISITTLALLFTHEVERSPILVSGLGQGPAFPQKAIEFIKQHRIEGNMYNSYIFGGYLIWGLYPERKVFVDGRAEIYDKGFQDAFISGPSLNRPFEVVNKYDINYAVIAYLKGGVDPIGDWIASDPKWILIYWDEVARIYVRDIPRNQDIINSYGHRVMTNPIDFNYESLKDAVNRGVEDRLGLELRKDIESDPQNSKALYWLGMLYYETGREEDSIAAWEKVVRIRPDANTFSNIGNLFAEKGLYAKAIEYYKKAVANDKQFAEAYYNLGNAYELMGDKSQAATAYRKFIKYAGPEYADAIRELKDKGIE